jgi:hypothetical protein
MGQWGQERSINNARFMPHVNTRGCFSEIKPHHNIDDVFLLSDGDDKDGAEKTLSRLKEKHIEQPYSLW